MLPIGRCQLEVLVSGFQKNSNSYSSLQLLCHGAGSGVCFSLFSSPASPSDRDEEGESELDEEVDEEL